MNTVTSYSQRESTERTVEVFSTEPELRSVEVAFVQRLVEGAQQTAARLLGPRAKRRESDFSAQFDADFARMQSPVAKRIARMAEQALPEKVGFRRFGEKR